MLEIENIAKRIDYDTTVLIFFAILLILENLTPRSKFRLSSSTQKENWIWVILDHFVIGGLSLSIISFIISNISNVYRYLGIFNYDLTSLHALIQFAIYILTFSFSTYTIHRLNHTVPYLWNIHALHHSSEELTVTATFRDHPLSLVYVEVFSFMIVRTMIFSEAVRNVADIFTMCWILFTHSNLNIRSPFLSKFLIMPHDHLWHHSKECKKRKGQNYGSILSIWDHLFNTYYSDETITKCGVNHIYPKSIIKKLIYPFPRFFKSGDKSSTRVKGN
ncbi:sterol desaturase family protein [Halobacteriovorax marinus]|uniref:sterol desaturase family protein n=1 Tax=Halobacteriovorax marinus TaxID=97084 RepID=UPI003A8EFD05